MKILSSALAVAVLLGAAPLSAAEISVDMLNKSAETGERMVFEPAIVRVDVGETVNWVASAKGHNVEFIKGAFPDGVEPFKSRLNKDVSYTFTEPGIYVYKCTPHLGMGMIGVVVVGGDMSNLEDVASARYPGKAKKRVAALLDEIDS